MTGPGSGWDSCSKWAVPALREGPAMATSIFLTYARSDGDDFSRELADALRRRREGFTVIRDRDEHYAGLDWQDWVEASIKGSDVLLFVMTRKSVKSRPCKNEWRLAQEHDIRVIPLLVHRVTRPMGLGDAHYIDFTGDQEVGFRELIANLRHLQEEQPRHRLRVFEAEYAAAERDLEQGGPRLEERRARKDVDWARERVEQQQRVADDPQGVRRSIDAEITQDLSDKRPPGSSARRLKIRSVNEPPHVPDSFRDRRPATTDLLNQLRSDAVRLVVVVGREGIGKSALVGRVMTAVAKGEQLDDARLDVSGLVYLKTTGLKPFSVSTMLSDLGSLLDEDAFDRLKVLLESPSVLPPVKLMALLAELGDQRVIVLIDNFEQLVDPDTWELRDDDQFSAVLTGLMQLQSHKVKIILTTQRLPKLSLEHPGMLGFIDLDHQGGLPSPYAEEALKALDRDGSAGLRDAPDHLLAKAQELTKGHHKALEALHLLLMTSREVSLEEIVSDPDPPHEVADAWIGKAFGRLGREEQRVLQALAIYGLPVSAAAVDYLLRDHLDGPAAPVLGRLARMRLVLKRPDQLYELVLVGRQWVLDTILAGEPADRDEIPAPFTRAALLHHGAEYFARKQPPDDRCLRLEDLTYHLAEIDLRTLGGDDRAVDLLVRVGKFLFRLGQAERVLKLLKPLEEQLTHPLLRIPLLIMGGRAYRRLGDHERAIGRYQQALRLAEEQDDRWNQAVALTNLGGCYYLLGQAREAGDHYQAARAAAQRAGNRTEQLAALSGHCLVSWTKVTSPRPHGWASRHSTKCSRTTTSSRHSSCSTLGSSRLNSAVTRPRWNASRPAGSSPDGSATATVSAAASKVRQRCSWTTATSVGPSPWPKRRSVSVTRSRTRPSSGTPITCSPWPASRPMRWAPTASSWRPPAPPPRRRAGSGSAIGHTATSPPSASSPSARAPARTRSTPSGRRRAWSAEPSTTAPAPTTHWMPGGSPCQDSRYCGATATARSRRSTRRSPSRCRSWAWSSRTPRTCAARRPRRTARLGPSPTPRA